MSKENLEQFCRLVLRDAELQNQLKNITERSEFTEKVCAMGAAAGFEFSSAEIAAQMRENRKMWNERWI